MEVLKQVELLEKELFSEPWDNAMINAELNNESNINLFYNRNSKICAYLLCQTVLDEANILRIGVSRDIQNQKIATFLIATLIDECKNRGINKVFLEVSENNIVAIKLYNNAGFKCVYTRKDYYKDGSSALVYQLNI